MRARAARRICAFMLKKITWICRFKRMLTRSSTKRPLTDFSLACCKGQKVSKRTLRTSQFHDIWEKSCPFQCLSKILAINRHLRNLIKICNNPDRLRVLATKFTTKSKFFSVFLVVLDRETAVSTSVGCTLSKSKISSAGSISIGSSFSSFEMLSEPLSEIVLSDLAWCLSLETEATPFVGSDQMAFIRTWLSQLYATASPSSKIKLQLFQMYIPALQVSLRVRGRSSRQETFVQKSGTYVYAIHCWMMGCDEVDFVVTRKFVIFNLVDDLVGLTKLLRNPTFVWNPTTHINSSTT